MRAEGTIRPRVCVVDDDPAFRELLATILDEMGCEVGLFDGREPLLDRLVADAPNLIILDLVLPGATGEETVRACRDDPELTGVPIVVCSADVHRLRGIGDDLRRYCDVHLIEKPFELRVLTDLLGDLLGRLALEPGAGPSHPIRH